MQDPVLDKAIEVFSPPQACQAPSGTMSPSLLAILNSSFEACLYSSLALLLATSFGNLGT